MRENQIRIKQFEAISILKYKGYQTVNEHGIVEISVRIASANKEEYIQRALKETWIEIEAADLEGKTKVLFYGILVNCTFENRVSECIMNLTLNSGSKLMDYEKHDRSFQEHTITYKNAVDCCISKYEQSGIIMTEGKQNSLPGFTMQYQESDWEFLKRLASTLNTVIVPSCTHQGVKIFFGVPEKKNSAILDGYNYCIQNDFHEYEMYKSDGIKRLKTNFVDYIVKERELLQLGDNVEFLGKHLCIWKIETTLEGNELYHIYYLRIKDGICAKRIYNNHLTGVSLLARVLKVQKEELQIQINKDENKGKAGCKWFSFSTVYSSADGTGWYCMPEINDLVRLYFPTNCEEDAYIISAVHEEGGRGIRTNPLHKIWRNKEGKEIRMEPDKVLLTNNKGSSIELSDHNGIKINSEGTIRLTAANSVSISSSGAGLELKALKKLVLNQGDTKMEFNDGIRLTGADIKM